MELEDHIIEFAINTITGMESGFYKVFPDKTMLTTNDHQSIINGFIIDYLNRTYRSLILHDDPYITETFGKMAPFKHSFVCILNIIAYLIKYLIENTQRQLLNTSSYSHYMTSIRQQLYILSTLYRSKLNLSHSCHGTDITTCNPDEPMFSSQPKK